MTRDLIKKPSINPPESFIQIKLSISTNDSNLWVLVLRSIGRKTPWEWGKISLYDTTRPILDSGRYRQSGGLTLQRPIVIGDRYCLGNRRRQNALKSLNPKNIKLLIGSHFRVPPIH